MKRAIFVRSKMTIMAELEKRAREKGIYKASNPQLSPSTSFLRVHVLSY